MLLVTTAHPRVWPPEIPVLALGEWCLDAARPHNHDTAATTMTPYHWDDREALYADFLYLEDLHERLLPRLAEALNALHGLDRPVRYWRLVAGYWLKLYGSVLLDRFRSIDTVARGGLATHTLALPGDRTRTILETSRHFVDAVSFPDDWNHYCYLALIEELTDIKINRLPATAAEPISPRLPLASRKRIRGWIKRGLTRLASIELSDRQTLVAFDLNLPVAAGLRFGWKVTGHPFVWSPTVTVAKAPIRPELRAKLALDAGTTPFEQLFGRLLPRFIPASLVEDFSALRERALAAYPKRPRVIVTAQFHLGNDAACIWAAEQREHGARFYIAQHGGHYGVDRFEAQEEHELQIADRYFSWGWQRTGHPNIAPMPSMQLSAAKTTADKQGGDVLFVYDTVVPYAYRLFCIPIAGQRRSYISNQIALLAALPEPILRRSRLRLHPVSERCRFALRAELNHRGWGGLIDNGRRDIRNALARARLTIATVNSTSFLQTFSMNFPTLLYWDARYNELRPEACSYYDALREAGILHHSADTAANKIAEVFADPVGWWSEARVQDARRRFVNRFAWSSESWTADWRDELLR